MDRELIDRLLRAVHESGEDSTLDTIARLAQLSPNTVRRGLAAIEIDHPRWLSSDYDPHPDVQRRRWHLSPQGIEAVRARGS
jgi:DNA-binding IclR family transcriptional regulator